MSKITVDFDSTVGKIKPMHGVNNGPSGSRGRGNFGIFKELQFPYARTHDASLNSDYGKNVVDVHLVFPDFDADENSPENYDFTLTDKLVEDTYGVGTKIFYRLGASIEHAIKKYGTIPPKDNLKWAKICEHIIMHYNFGWADGFSYNIEYWEIWNETDCRNADGSNPCWQGTDEEFCQFFCTVFKYLKEKFPALKIGGPAMSYVDAPLWHPFLASLKNNGINLDFYSYHGYTKDVNYYVGTVKRMEDMLKQYGLKRTEIILNEWNYVRSFNGEDFTYSIKMIKSIKGASFAGATMYAMQHTDIDSLMYYDARMCAYNCFCEDYTYEKLKGYFAFLNFSRLYKMGTEATSISDDGDIFVCAAKSDREKGIGIVYFNDDDNALNKQVCVEIKGVKKGTRAEIYLTDRENDNNLVRTDYISTGHAELYFNLKNFDQIFVEIKEE